MGIIAPIPATIPVFPLVIAMNDFFNTHPVLPTVAIGFNIGACAPILFLLLVVRKTPLHGNCRFLCYIWLIGYIVLFNASIALWIASLLDEHGYLSQSFKSPPHRLFLYEFCASCSLFCTVCEIAIAVERIWSTSNPEQYYNAPTSSAVLISFTIVLIISTYLFGIVAFEYDQFIIAGAFLLTSDVLTLVTNTFSVRYTKRRFDAAFENLNAKYQIKEAYQMSAAMKPLYMAIFVVKSIIGTSSIICLSTGNPYAIGYNDMLYSCANAVCASLVTIMLIRKHPLLNKHARIWLRLQTSAAPVHPTSLTEAEQHFESLRKCWE